MIIIYTPEGGEPEQYDARSLRVSEASIVQRTIDMKWADIQQGLHDEDLDAMRGVVWVLKKRSQPSLRFGEFDPGIDEMVTRMDKREITAYVEAAFQMVDADPEVTREHVAQALREIPTAAADPDHAEALIAKLAQDPKDSQGQEDPAPEGDGEQSSPTLTSSEPETPSSPSSDTSSTTPLASSTA